VAKSTGPDGGWESLARLAEYDANKLAKRCGLSIRQLQRRFHEELRASPQSWLDEQRIAAAEQLLILGYQVKRVAFDLGFKQSSHFCRQFKSRKRMTPSEFVQSHTRTKMSLTDNKTPLTSL
jgi:AraC-like DNA-binding protein